MPKQKIKRITYKKYLNLCNMVDDIINENTEFGNENQIINCSADILFEYIFDELNIQVDNIRGARARGGKK